MLSEHLLHVRACTQDSSRFKDEPDVALVPEALNLTENIRSVHNYPQEKGPMPLA